jgi:transitional endoplasmic reticulum ATPase
LKILKVQRIKTLIALNVDMETLAEKSDNHTRMDLENLVRAAGLQAIRQNINAKAVTMEDFDKAMHRIKPSLDVETIKYYEGVSINMGRESKPARREDLVYYR